MSNSSTATPVASPNRRRRHGGRPALPITISPVKPSCEHSRSAQKNQGEARMNAITTKDGTTIFYKDWGTGPTSFFRMDGR